MPELSPSCSRIEELVVAGVKVADNILTSQTETEMTMQQPSRFRKPFEYYNRSNHLEAASQVMIDHPVYWERPCTMQRRLL